MESKHPENHQKGNCGSAVTKNLAALLLSVIQRLVCLSVKGAMKTTPTPALEAIVNLPPLHVYIQV